MAVTFSSTTLLLLFLHLLAASTTTTTAVSIPAHDELETALESLRSHGYRLFTNAIVTSEIQFQLLHRTTTTTNSADAHQFTLFAPRDGPIYDLDMRSDAADYVRTLRYHVIPNRRLTFSDLRNLSSPFVSTLLPHFSILIGKTLEGGRQPIVGVMVNGARVSHPDLFIGPNIAVHGINGILSSGFNLQHEDLVDDSQTGSGHFSPVGSPEPAVAHSGLSYTPVAAPITEDVPVETSPIGGQENADNKAPEPPISRKAPVKKSPAGGQQNADKRRRRRQKRRKQHRRNNEL